MLQILVPKRKSVLTGKPCTVVGWWVGIVRNFHDEVSEGECCQTSVANLGELELS